MSQHHMSQSANILSQLICVDEYHSSIRDRSSSLDGSPASTGGRRTGSGRRVPAVIQYYSHPSSTGPLLLSNLSSAHHSSSLSTVSTGFFAPPSLVRIVLLLAKRPPWNPAVALYGRIQWALIYVHMTVHSAIFKTLLPRADAGILA